MKPRSFSASALQVASGCLARYKATSIDRGDDLDNGAALLGTSVHGALEAYVKMYMGVGTAGTLDDLLLHYRVSYMDTFETSDTSGADFEEGVEMLKAWFKRTTLGHVISAEVKESYPVKTSIGEIPFNYIWDRFDKIGPHEYAVIDYKTNRWSLTPDQLRKKIQARMYGVMAQIKYPDAERIHVKFDMLRHDGPVGVVFSKEENTATWRWFKEEVERIIAADEDNPPETLNPECSWCIRKATCGTLASNVAVGGIMSLTLDEMIDRRAEIGFQMNGLKNLSEQLDAMIEAEAKKQDTLEFSTNSNRVYFAVSGRRSVDAARVAQVVGDKVFLKYGGAKLTIGEFDKLIKDPELTEDQRSLLKGLVYKSFGEPSLKVDKASPFGP